MHQPPAPSSAHSQIPCSTRSRMLPARGRLLFLLAGALLGLGGCVSLPVPQLVTASYLPGSPTASRSRKVMPASFNAGAARPAALLSLSCA